MPEPSITKICLTITCKNFIQIDQGPMIKLLTTNTAMQNRDQNKWIDELCSHFPGCTIVMLSFAGVRPFKSVMHGKIPRIRDSTEYMTWSCAIITSTNLMKNTSGVRSWEKAKSQKQLRQHRKTWIMSLELRFIYQHIGAWTIWPSFCRRHFQIYFLVWTVFILIQIS